MRAVLGGAGQLEAELGVNLLYYFLKGAADTHTGLSTIDEDNFFGMFTTYEQSVKRAEYAVPVIRRR